LFERFTPRFVKKYADLHAEMERAFTAYRLDVEDKLFPADEHSIEMPDSEWLALLDSINHGGR